MSTVSADKKQLRAKYRELTALVSGVISEWDPYSLIGGGAPRGEFDAEVALVAVQVSRITSAQDASEVISAVFSSAFESPLFKVEACRDVGERLFVRLKANGFVT
jgi:hypothetical protein